MFQGPVPCIFILFRWFVCHEFKILNFSSEVYYTEHNKREKAGEGLRGGSVRDKGEQKTW